MVESAMTALSNKMQNSPHVDWLTPPANVTPNGVNPYAVTPSAAKNCPIGRHIVTTSRIATTNK